PEAFSVGADVAHVGTAATGHGPCRLDLARREIDDRDAARAALHAVDLVRAAIRDVELRAVAARIEAVRADARLDESDLPERLAVDHEDAVGMHGGDEEALAVGRDADVLRHTALRELEIARDLAVDEIDLREPAVELAREDRERAV